MPFAVWRSGFTACLCVLVLACSDKPAKKGTDGPKHDASIEDGSQDAGDDARAADRDAAQPLDAATGLDDAAADASEADAADGSDAETDAAMEPVPVCGDGLHDSSSEACDDGNTLTERCAYGAVSCTVCSGSCETVSGAFRACGDGQVDGPDETCDDSNTVTEACAYGAMSCTVCNATCQSAAGSTEYCGDGQVAADHAEVCDDGNRTPGDGCDADCHVEYVASCGNGTLDSAEQCDDGNITNLDGCTAACKRDNGWTCPTVNAGCHEQCGDQLVVGAEICDDGNTVDGDYCSNNCRTARRCGDGAQQSAAGEQCDDANTATEACSYGQTSCSVCDSTCHSSTGSTSFCGDGTIQAVHGEQCEPASDMRCGSDCKFKCDTVYITYGATGNLQLTSTSFGLGDGTFPQTGMTITVALPAGPTGPVNGSAGITYLNAPAMMSQNIAGTSIVTNLVGKAGTAASRCPLDASTLTGSQLLRGACPYLGSHGTANWTPSQQQVTAPNGPGCLEYASTGTITCSGSLCSTAGLSSGVNQINDLWDQPGATLVFTNGFSKVQSRALGTPPAGSGQPTDKLEIPNAASGRTWTNFDGTETSRVCAMKPTNCPTPGAK